MIRRSVALGLGLACGLASCRTCPCPPGTSAPPVRVASAEPPRVFIDVTCVRMPEAAVAALPAGAASYSTVILDGGQKDALFVGWAEDKTVEVVSAPKILALAGERASVFVVEEFAPSAGASGAAPSRGVAPVGDASRAWIGMKIFVTPTLASGAVELDVDATWSEARHPDATEVAGLDIRRARIGRRLRLTPEQTALVVADGALEREGKSCRMVLVVAARGIDTERTESASARSLRAESPGRTFASKTGTATWTWAGSLTDTTEMTITGAAGRRLFASDRRGLYESRDGGMSWACVGNAAEIRAHPSTLKDPR